LATLYDEKENILMDLSNNKKKFGNKKKMIIFVEIIS
jgi:hypothetical protein